MAGPPEVGELFWGLTGFCGDPAGGVPCARTLGMPVFAVVTVLSTADPEIKKTTKSGGAIKVLCFLSY